MASFVDASASVFVLTSAARIAVRSPSGFSGNLWKRKEKKKKEKKKGGGGPLFFLGSCHDNANAMSDTYKFNPYVADLAHKKLHGDIHGFSMV